MEIVERVVNTLSPYLGQMAARASVRMFLEKAGLTPSQVGAEHLDRLAETLKPGLKVFVGAAKAEALVAEIRRLRESGG